MVSWEERRTRGELQKLSRHAGKKRRKELLEELRVYERRNNPTTYKSTRLARGYESRSLTLTPTFRRRQEDFSLYPQSVESEVRRAPANMASFLVGISLLRAGIQLSTMVSDENSTQDPLRLPNADDQDALRLRIPLLDDDAGKV